MDTENLLDLKNSYENLFEQYYGPFCLYAHRFIDDEDVCKDIVDSIIISNEERRVKINYNGSKGKNYIYADIDMFRSIFQK
jgi:RNA polymerase sigma-70 factor (ECF subfamily)